MISDYMFYGSLQNNQCAFWSVKCKMGIHVHTMGIMKSIMPILLMRMHVIESLYMGKP